MTSHPQDPAEDAASKPASDWILAFCLGRLNRHAPETRFFDKLISTLQFRLAHSRWPGQKETLQDALLALKNSDDILSPDRVKTTDKELAKTFVEEHAGPGLAIPTLAVLRNKEEANAFAFPARCAIKPTHGSGDFIIRRNGEPIDMPRVLRWFDMNYYRVWREANYRDLTPKVIIEPIIFDADLSNELKIFCHQGRVKVIKYYTGSHTNKTSMLYTADWRPLHVALGTPLAPDVRPRPSNLEAIIEVVEKLAAHFELVRIDLYCKDDAFFIGELTHIDHNATGQFFPPDAEDRISRLILHGEHA
ncbi:ATP-grasp fold amidoligase family protein [Stappia sp. ES.058]|uniref:ATP-grasp fold amidoligase family protein n=1 Tax=Stappia sp. ES.058 TaxID=1881061 RepID=UPI00087D248E|nr:ATP-grasp fold amidoligase family protein [Stappia sp. ES.058]SDU17281.1 TupA-like ATPgrasp [Stappia sp. ES.058]